MSPCDARNWRLKLYALDASCQGGVLDDYNRGGGARYAQSCLAVLGGRYGAWRWNNDGARWRRRDCYENQAGVLERYAKQQDQLEDLVYLNLET